MPRPKKYSLGYAVEAAAPLVALMTLLKLVELLAGLSFAGLGMVPRTPPGAIAILTASLLPGSLSHLFATVGPLFVLLVLLFSVTSYHPPRTLTMLWLASGVRAWLLGRAAGPNGELAVHVGA